MACLARNATKHFILLAICHSYFLSFLFLLNVYPKFKYLRCVLFACIYMCVCVFDGKQYPHKNRIHIKRGCDHSQFHFHSHSHSKRMFHSFRFFTHTHARANVLYTKYYWVSWAHRNTNTHNFDTLPFGMYAICFCWFNLFSQYKWTQPNDVFVQWLRGILHIHIPEKRLHSNV